MSALSLTLFLHEVLLVVGEAGLIVTITTGGVLSFLLQIDYCLDAVSEIFKKIKKV